MKLVVLDSEYVGALAVELEEVNPELADERNRVSLLWTLFMRRCLSRLYNNQIVGGQPTSNVTRPMMLSELACIVI